MVALRGEVRAAALMEAGGASGREQGTEELGSE